jgi:hypothetical protein
MINPPFWGGFFVRQKPLAFAQALEAMVIIVSVPVRPKADHSLHRYTFIHLLLCNRSP